MILESPGLDTKYDITIIVQFTILHSSSATSHHLSWWCSSASPEVDTHCSLHTLISSIAYFLMHISVSPPYFICYLSVQLLNADYSSANCISFFSLLLCSGCWFIFSQKREQVLLSLQKTSFITHMTPLYLNFNLSFPMFHFRRKIQVKINSGTHPCSSLSLFLLHLQKSLQLITQGEPGKQL